MTREETVTEMEKMLKGTSDPEVKRELGLMFATALMAGAPPVTKTTLGGAPPVMDPDPSTLADERARRQLISCAALALSHATNRPALDMERQLTAAMAGRGAGMTTEEYGAALNGAMDAISTRIFSAQQPQQRHR